MIAKIPQGEILGIALTDSDLVTVELCTVNGVMNDLTGAPVVGAIISANLSALANEVRAQVCGSDCIENSSSDSEGRFSLTLLIAGVTLVRGFGQVTPLPGSTAAARSGQVRFDWCPTTDVQIIADKGTDFYDVSITRVDDLIRWDPPVSASRVFVAKAQQYLKWAVKGPVESPATYGVVPGAAIQDIPSDGNAPREALDSGDLIRIFASEPGDGFYEKYYEGKLLIP